MSERDRISIITPSYRPGAWLRLCIASVADQAGVDVEHIVQDAESDDGTADWLRTEPRVRAFVEKDAGMYDAINRGLQRAAGKIVAYLNCDEQYLPGTLARVADYFSRHPGVDVLFGDALLVNENGNALSYRRVVRPGQLHTRLDHLGTLSCAMFFRRTLVEEGFVFPTRYQAIGDAVFVSSLLAARKRTAALGKPLSTFAFTGGNLGQTQRAAAEGRQWRETAGGLIGRLRRAVVWQHRLRKLAAGAYRLRDVEYAIYTRESPGQRVLFHAPRLGWHWPGPSAAKLG